METARGGGPFSCNVVLEVLVAEHGVVGHEGEHDNVESHDDVHEAQHGQKHPPRRRTYSMTCGPGHHFNYEEPPMTVEFEGWCFFFRYRHPVLEVIKRKR